MLSNSRELAENSTTEGWEHDSVIEPLPSMCNALSSSPSTGGNSDNKKTEKEKRRTMCKKTEVTNTNPVWV